MKRIIAMVLSVLMTVLGSLGIAVPGITDNAITQGDFVAAVQTDFGFTEEVVKAEKADAYATNKFVYETLTAAVAKTGAKDEVTVEFASNRLLANKEEALAELGRLVTACNNQKVPATPESEVTAQAGVVDLTGIECIAEGGKVVFAADVALKAGDKFLADTGAYVATAVAAADGATIVDAQAIAIEEAVEAIDFEGSVEADLDKATVYDQNGDVIEDAAEPTVAGQGVIKDKAGELIEKGKEAAMDFLKNPKISFSVKGFKVKAAYSGGRVDLSVAGNVADGVRVEKYYTLNNIKFDTKYDANLAKLQIKEAYLKMNYDLTETTVLQGSYAASVVPEGGSFTNEGANFLEKVKNNLSNLDLVKGGGVKVNVFTFDIPIGSTGLTVEMNVSLTLSACGRIEIVVTSNETKGYEIINNKGRVIHDSIVYDRAYNISGDFRVVLGLDLSLTFLKYKIVDVEVAGGLGAYVTTEIFNVKTHVTVTENIPLDVAVEATSGMSDLADLRFCADVELYGILSVSVGQNSIIKKIGLSKTWNFFDRGNGTFAHLHIENSGIVDDCTYKAA